MLSVEQLPHLNADPGDVDRSFNREPFGFTHNVHELPLLAFDSLRELAGKYDQADHFVASGAPAPGTQFYSVAHGMLTPQQAMDELGNGSHRVLMKRPENYDPRFRALLDSLFAQVVQLHPNVAQERIVRLESSVLVSSAASITPFHFDPEMSFFFQIEGEKVYHLRAPAVVTEPDLERFYKMGVVNIGQLDFATYESTQEFAFTLLPGFGLHQPQNSPHWVETRGARTISYVFSFETERSRATGRTRSFNHYMRKAGLRPAAPGAHPRSDAFKARTMEVAIPLRRAVRNALSKGFGR